MPSESSAIATAASIALILSSGSPPARGAVGRCEYAGGGPKSQDGDPDIGPWIAEFIATFGLLLMIASGRLGFPAALPGAIAAYILAAYWFTRSTSFANPAVTLARALTDTFAGIAPGNVVAFILAQSLGAAMAIVLLRWPGGTARA